MKKLDNFSNCLDVLKNADFELANENEIQSVNVKTVVRLRTTVFVFKTSSRPVSPDNLHSFS